MIASILAALFGGRLLAWPTTVRLRRRLAAALWQLRRDPLTGLINRTGFTETFAARQTQPVIVLFDLDGFKNVNDRHGHGVGDQLLLASADRIRSAAALHGGLTARLSGDEFAVLLPTDRDLDRGIELILTLLAAPVIATIEDTTVAVAVTASAGVCAGAAGDTLDLILRRADIAMYHAKRMGGVHVRYETGMQMPPVRAPLGARLRDRHDKGRVRS
jgi:diguanylate cyclase (GGDEF)-like protein